MGRGGRAAVTAPVRKGFGSTVLAQVIPFELNGSSTPRYHRLGYCLDIVLPAAVAQCVERPAAAPRPSDEHIVTAPADIKRLLAKCLLVEDNLFIAIDAEDLLRSLGAEMWWSQIQSPMRLLFLQHKLSVSRFWTLVSARRTVCPWPAT